MRSIILLVGLILTFDLFPFLISAQECNCPTTNIERLNLKETESSKQKECTNSNGQTFCIYTCKYRSTTSNAEMWLSVGWVTQSTPEKLSASCKSGGSSYWIILSEKKKLAFIHTYATAGHPDYYYEALRLSKYLLSQVEPYALDCPGAEKIIPNPDPRSVMGTIVLKQGVIDIFDPQTNTWINYDSTKPQLYSYQKIRTGYNSKVTIRINNDKGLEEFVELGENAQMDVKIDPKEPSPGVKGYVMHLLKGVFGYRRGSVVLGAVDGTKGSVGLTKVTTPTLTVEPDGTIFIIRYDAVSKRDFIILREGKLQLKVGTMKKTLLARQQLYTSKNKYSELRTVPENVWQKILRGEASPGPSVYNSGVIIRSKPPLVIKNN